MQNDYALWFAIAAQAVGFIVWIVRLEARLYSLQDRYTETQQDRLKKELIVIDRLDRIEARVDKIDIMAAEIRNDLKWLVDRLKKENN